MIASGGTRQLALEDLTGKFFLVAGGTALAVNIGSSLGVFALVPVPDALAALPLLWMAESLPVLASLPLAIVSVLALYPKLVDRTPTVARSSLLLATGPWAIFIAVIAWGLASLAFPAVPFSADALLSTHTVWLSLWLVFFLGIGLFALSLLRTDRYRLAGGGFLLFVVVLNGPLLFTQATSYPPNRLLWLTSPGTALAMVVIGYSVSFGQGVSESAYLSPA